MPNLKLFYCAIRDLNDNSISDCSILAENYESAEKILRKEYNSVYDYYEFELMEQDEEEKEDYFENYPDDKKTGLYNHAPNNYAYMIFV